MRSPLAWGREAAPGKGSASVPGALGPSDVMRTAGVPAGAWEAIAARIERLTGLKFPPERHADLRRLLSAAAQELGYGREPASTEAGAQAFVKPGDKAADNKPEDPAGTEASAAGSRAERPARTVPATASAPQGSSNSRSLPDAVLASFLHTLLHRRVEGPLLQLLARHLTVGETYFFRDAPLLEHLAETLLPELIAQKRRQGLLRLRLWSAGCCSGEEAYTLAILMHRLLPDPQAWDLEVLGTDLNAASIAKAELGLYGEWSFRGAPEWLRPGYFEPVDGERYQVKPMLRPWVRFSVLNLIDLPMQPQAWPQGMDLIACRNVLMYFSAPQMSRVVESLRLRLQDGGWLMLGAAESALIRHPGFETVSFNGVTFFRKQAPQALLDLPKSRTASAGQPNAAQAGEQADEQTGEQAGDGGLRGARASLQTQAAAGSAPQPASPLVRTPTARAVWQLTHASAPQAAAQAEEGAAGLTPEGVAPAAGTAPLAGAASSLFESAVDSGSGRFASARSGDLTAVLAGPLTDPSHAAGATAFVTSAATLAATAGLESLARQARAFANQGRFDEALQLCDRWLQADKIDAAAHYTRAIVMMEQGDLAGARTSLQRAVFLQEHFVLAHFALGNLAVRQHHPERATRHFLNAQRALQRQSPAAPLPESEGLSCLQMQETLQALLGTTTALPVPWQAANSEESAA